MKKNKKIKEEKIDIDELEDIKEEDIEDDAPKKKKNQNLQKNPIHSYQFWIKIFACVLLIILAFMLFFKEDSAQAIVLMFTGGVFSIYAVMRIVPLMRTLEKGMSRVLCLIEIVFDLLAGVLLIALAVQNFGNKPEGFVGWCCDHYNIVIGLVLWLRGFVYFTTTILVGEKTDKAQFFVHIAIITFGSFLLGVKIDAANIAIALAVISLVCGIVIGGEGFYDYGKYRNRIKQTRTGTTKKKEKEKKPEIEAPAREDDAPEVPDDSVNDTPIIEPENDDRPYVS